MGSTSRRVDVLEAWAFSATNTKAGLPDPAFAACTCRALFPEAVGGPNCHRKPSVARIFASVSPRTQASRDKTHAKNELCGPRDHISIGFTFRQRNLLQARRGLVGEWVLR